MSGILGWSPGNQSAGPKPSRICARVNSRSLPVRCFGLVSGAACAPRPPPRAGPDVAPGSGKPYAQAGGPSAAKARLTVNTDRRAMIRIPCWLLICVLTLHSTFDRRALQPAKVPAGSDSGGKLLLIFAPSAAHSSREREGYPFVPGFPFWLLDWVEFITDANR